MSIAVLNQLYDEVRRLAIAGSDLAAGDFRLKKLVPPLKQSGQKAPVFAKIAEAVEQLLDCSPKTSAARLLELSSLVGAVLYTQGATGGEGTLEPLESANVELSISRSSARVLKPLIEALTTTGSGRLEIIESAHERGAFKDIRLIQHAIKAIDDPYGEIAEFVSENVLPLYGRAIVPLLRDAFNGKGKMGDARRLKLMHALDAVATRELVAQALEEGSKELKLAAIECLEGRADTVDFLLEQTKARSEEIRAAAFRALATIDAPAAVEALKVALSGKNIEHVAEHLARNPNAELAAFVVAEAARELEAVLHQGPRQKEPTPATGKSTKAGKGKSAKSSKSVPSAVDLSRERMERLFLLLDAVSGRKDEAAQELLLTCLDARDALMAVKTGGTSDAECILGSVGYALVLAESERGLTRLAKLGAGAHAALMPHVFHAMARLRTPAEVFEELASVIASRATGRSKAAVESNDRADALAGVLIDHVDRELTLDPRWLDAALDAGDNDLVHALGVKGHARMNDYLAGLVDAQLQKKGWNPSYDLDDILRTMIKCEHPRAVELYVQIIGHVTTRAHDWDGYRFMELMRELPASAVAPLKAMIPAVKSHWLDDFVEQLNELERTHDNDRR